jgi:hypothetical protein
LALVGCKVEPIVSLESIERYKRLVTAEDTFYNLSELVQMLYGRFLQLGQLLEN